MLCLTLTGSDVQESLNQYRDHADAVQMVEVRADLLSCVDEQKIAQLVQTIDVPKILTCRRVRDGGRYKGSERSRLQILERLIPLGFSYVDLEDDVKRPELDALAHEHGLKIIRSFHDMEGVPGDLYTRIVKLHKRGDIPKAAVMVRSINDAIMLFKIEKELRDIPEKVIIGMGDYGIPVRILYKRTGSLFTFCSPTGTSAASGHLSPEIMHDLYHSDRVTPETRIYGIIGNPVMHTSSPKIHNPAFERTGLDAIYVPFLVNDVRNFFQLADLLSIQGFSVTVPHKQHVLPYLGKISREVKLIGSCNTVLRYNTLWKGVNTDFYGFLKPIQEELDGQRIRKAVVIGAGGAARAVVWALRNYYCKVVILNRTEATAQKLAQETGSSWGGLQEIDKITGADLIVQTTSAGMPPQEEINPIETYCFDGHEIVYDLVYKPKRTRFLQKAEAAGCKLVYGMDMLVAQGILQFESFTGSTFPDDLR